MTEPHVGAHTDEHLLSRVVAGEEAAFAEFFSRHQQLVYRFARHMGAGPEMADDVTQDVFVAVMRDAVRFDGRRSTAQAWLCGIARNMVRRRFDLDRRLVPLDSEPTDESEPTVDTAEDALTSLVRGERVAHLRQAITALPLRFREAVVLCDLHEWSYADAAAALDCAIGTVRSRLHRGRALLAVSLGVRKATPGADLNLVEPSGTQVRCAP